MIDWYSGLLGYDGSMLRPNTVCELTPEGATVWSSERKLQVKGSYDTAVLVGRSAPTDAMTTAADKYGLLCAVDCLYVSGNPAKWLQGHNVFGPSVHDLGPVLRSLVRSFPAEVRPADAVEDVWPAVHRSRVDVTTTVDMGSHRLVHEWLRAAASSTRSRHGRALVSGDTVYWGQHSRRWTMKAYCKFCELQAHPPQVDGWRDRLLPWTEGQLRLELCLRGQELKPRGTLEEAVIWEYMNRIEVGIMKDTSDGFDGVAPLLPRGVRLTLREWVAGVDVRHTLPGRTFYRHRRLILDELGLDISLTYHKDTAEREVFDLAYLRAHEVGAIPDSMQGLLFKVDGGPVWPSN